MNRSKKFRTALRKGLSMMELILVLAILTVVAAIALPTFDAIVSRNRIRQSVDRLEVELQEARMAAIHTGQAQMFRFQIGTGEYLSQPWMSDSDTANAGPGATVQTMTGELAQTGSNPLDGLSVAQVKGSKSLNEGVTVSSANTQNDSRTMMAQLEAGASQGASWSAPILFYPDGSSTTAEIIVQDILGNRQSLQIRGLTGQVNIVPLPGVEGM